MSALLTLLALVVATTPTPSGPEVHLLTMGPGDDLYTRAGHAALLVVERRADGSGEGKVYNYGATDWDDPALAQNFLTGHLTFFIADPETLEETLQNYGVQQNRDIYRQRLNLTPKESRAVVARLDHDMLPENRAYPYHHTNGICTTQIRSVLDEALGGALKQQLDDRDDEHTVRDYQQQAFEWKLPALLGADLFLGWRHDRHPTLYDVLFHPRRMRSLLQEVKLPPATPGGPARVLAQAPGPLTQRAGPPAIRESTKSATLIPIALVALLLTLLGWAIKGDDPRRGALWVLAALLPSGIVGALILTLVLVSDVPELASNELLLTFPPTDLLLAPAVIAVLRRGEPWAASAQLYGRLRLLGLVGVLVGHATGLLVQRPLMYVLLGCVCAWGLWWFTRPRATSEETEPLTPGTEPT